MRASSIPNEFPNPPMDLTVLNPLFRIPSLEKVGFNVWPVSTRDACEFWMIVPGPWAMNKHLHPFASAFPRAKLQWMCLLLGLGGTQNGCLLFGFPLKPTRGTDSMCNVCCENQNGKYDKSWHAPAKKPASTSQCSALKHKRVFAI